MEEVDILIRNGIIHDGSGNDPYQKDISIRDGSILKIDTNLKVKAEQVIEAKGLVVCPGFIDMHSHSDMT
ncbi:MAG: N-acyl-D-amino-acid deacylase family protein, partial [Candidatus Thorarchaeota archaeon]